MIRAILEGRKTMTRRVVKPQPMIHDSVGAVRSAGIPKLYIWGKSQDDLTACATESQMRRMMLNDAKHAPGDRLWVKETFRKLFCAEELPCLDCQNCRQSVAYKADDELPDNICAAEGYERQELWRPSIFMPRWASRILLEVVSVRVERLQDISPEDALAEGVFCPEAMYAQNGESAPRAVFYDLWESINGPGSWAANPWVWVIEFKEVKP
jgi:hypothetical protein